jgi:NAD(P)-dependent dehydrogenase (short-subunit alcohol dehydrogenase family)
MNYKDKIVLVTGAANGIGKAISKEYLNLGATVILADIDENAGLTFQKESISQGYQALYYKIDLKNVGEIRNMFRAVLLKYKKIDILINNAGIGRFKSILEVTEEDWDEVLNVNLRGMFFTSQEFAKCNKGTTYGRIVNISSSRFLMSEANTEAYSSSKGGIVSLTHALSISLSDENITVNCISPGWIENNNYEKLSEEDHNQHPSKRVGKPEDIARTCLFLTDEKNDFINGQNIIVDGGMTKKMIYIE